MSATQVDYSWSVQAFVNAGIDLEAFDNFFDSDATLGGESLKDL